MEKSSLSNSLDLRNKLRNRELMFAGWVSYAHPSIVETFGRAGFDFMLIDMEHSTISIEQAQRIIASSQSLNTPCIPRPVSHSNDYIKPLLESGSDGILIQMVETPFQVQKIIDHTKYPPIGLRTYGVNRAQGYGFDFDAYTRDWNVSSSLMIQIESVQGVQNIDEILAFSEVDAVMIGPLDLAGSLGVPGQTNHPKVLEASKIVIESCRKKGISCGTQLSSVSKSSVDHMFDLGYTYIILGSDLFVLYEWSRQMHDLIHSIKISK